MGDSVPSSKRTGYIDWDEYFMGVAFIAAERSKDPKTQVGACVVNENNIIVGVGYNGFPIGCSDDTLPWTSCEEDPFEDKKLYVCHAEMNAILNKNSASLKGCKIYVALYPCSECAKCIIQSGIKEVIYLSDKKHLKPKYRAAKRMFAEARIVTRQFVPKRKTIVIDFSKIDPELYQSEEEPKPPEPKETDPPKPEETATT